MSAAGRGSSTDVTIPLLAPCFVGLLVQRGIYPHIETYIIYNPCLCR